MRFSSTYTIVFAAAVCLVCSIFVTSATVGLRPLRAANEALYQRRNVLVAARIVEPGVRLSADQINQMFDRIEPVLIDMRTGERIREVDLALYDPDDEPTFAAAPNPAQVREIRERRIVYVVAEDGVPSTVILPVRGNGLWSTLYGFLALDADTYEVRGITFYQHGETPGLGGEVDNPNWQAKWEGKTAFDEDLNPIIEVVKGQAATEYQVDGLSGATLTTRGVSNLVRFWLGEHGYGPFLERFREQRGA